MIDQAVLIHIGYPKTSTTWLQKSVFLPEHGFSPLENDPKALGWPFIYGGIDLDSPFDFDAEAVGKRAETALKNAQHFPIISNEDLCSHPLGGGIQAESIGIRLSEVFKNALILITIREQSRCIQSLYEHYVRMGGICSPRMFLKPHWEHQISFFNPSVLRYDGLIQFYQNLFGLDRVCVVPYELLKHDPDKLLATLSDFTSVDLDKDKISFDAKNQTRPGEAAAARYLRYLNFLVGPRSNHNMRMGWGSKLVSRITWRGFSYLAPDSFWQRRRGKLLELIQDFSDDYYKESNQKTAELIDFDIKALGYSL